MNTTDFKLTILKVILDTEDLDLLRQVGKILLPHKKVSGTNEGEKIVGYDPDSSPITQSELEKRVEESEREIERGEYISQEELEKISENW